MAICHISVTTGSRGGGQSAAAKCNYICREAKYVKDKGELIEAISQNMPAWAIENPQRYWEAADLNERANGRLFQSLVIALPKELDAEQRAELAKTFAQVTADTKDGPLPYTLAIHRGKGENPHLHVMFSERVNDGKERDPGVWFSRAAVGKTAEQGGARKTTTMQDKEWMGRTRIAWTEIANQHLQRAGFENVKLDPRSYADRGTVMEPQVHEGQAARALAARGIFTDRVALNRKIKNVNAQTLPLRKEIGVARREANQIVIEAEADIQAEIIRKARPLSGAERAAIAINEIRTPEQERASLLATVRYLKNHPHPAPRPLPTQQQFQERRWAAIEAQAPLQGVNRKDSTSFYRAAAKHYGKVDEKTEGFIARDMAKSGLSVNEISEGIRKASPLPKHNRRPSPIRPDTARETAETAIRERAEAVVRETAKAAVKQAPKLPKARQKDQGWEH